MGCYREACTLRALCLHRFGANTRTLRLSMTKLETILLGTAVFLLTGFIATFLSFMSPAMSKDRGLTNLLITTATICCWLLWLITYMMQMNPLIAPKME